MSFPIALVGLVVIKLIISLIDKSVPKKIVTGTKGDRKTIKYVLNGRVLDKTYTKYALDILGIEYKTGFYIELVKDAYYKQREFLEEDQKLGFKVKASLIELKAARDYLIDLCVYQGAVN